MTLKCLAAKITPKTQGPEEMCLSLDHQNPSKTSEKWVILIALQFRYTFYRPQTKRLRDNQVLRRLSVKPKANVSCQ